MIINIKPRKTPLFLEEKLNHHYNLMSNWKKQMALEVHRETSEYYHNFDWLKEECEKLNDTYCDTMLDMIDEHSVIKYMTKEEVFKQYNVKV